MCPITSWTANQLDFSFQGLLGWCRVRSGRYCLMGWQTALGCLSLPLDEKCFVVFLLKWVAACDSRVDTTDRCEHRDGDEKASLGCSLKCFSLSPCEWDLHLPSQLLPTEFFWWCMAMRLAPTQPWVLVLGVSLLKPDCSRNWNYHLHFLYWLDCS